MTAQGGGCQRVAGQAAAYVGRGGVAKRSAAVDDVDAVPDDRFPLIR